MKGIRLLAIGLLTLLVSFFLFFTALEVYKHSNGDEFFRTNNPYDLVIKNGRIIDGTGGEIFKADIGVRDGKIIEIGNRLKTEGAKIFNATGFTVAPKKLEWPQKSEWVKRDLASALLRYPESRIIVAEAQDVEWRGKSVKTLLSSKGLAKSMLAKDQTALAWITPQLDVPEVEDINTAYYLLSGWRADLLGKSTGKIEESYQAQFVIFNHREINDEQLFAFLNKEELPPIQYIIEGSQIQSTKTDS